MVPNTLHMQPDFWRCQHEDQQKERGASMRMRRKGWSTEAVRTSCLVGTLATMILLWTVARRMVHNKQYDDTAFVAGAGTLPGHRQRSAAVGEAVPPLHATLTTDEASSMLDPVGGVVEAEVEAAPRVPTFVDVGGARRWSVLEPFDPRGAGASTGAVLRLAASSGVHRRLKIGAPDVTDRVEQDLLAASILAPSSRRLRAPGAFPVLRAEVVVAMHADSSQVSIVEASRAWRKDLRTLVVLESAEVAAQQDDRDVSQEHNEIWQHYLNDSPPRSRDPGDSRAAVTPFLAHQAFGNSFKWLLFGDEDTVFFVDNVLELLQDFDPSMPYIITDHFVWSNEAGQAGTEYHPHHGAPRCLPCHWSPADEELALQGGGQRAFQPYMGCPCIAELVCKYDARALFDTKTCALPKPSEHPYRLHGSAGALISIGLLKSVDLGFLQLCLQSLKESAGGDASLSVCLWRAGYAFTDPGYSFYHPEVQAFDPGAEAGADVLSGLGQLNRKDFTTCGSTCVDTVNHMVSTHASAAAASAQGPDALQRQAALMVDLSEAFDAWAASTPSAIQAFKSLQAQSKAVVKEQQQQQVLQQGGGMDSRPSLRGAAAA